MIEKSRKKLPAFTLAEVLITLGVIGVVAVITLPSFVQNHQTKVRNEQNRMVQYKLTQATDLMKSHGKIGNYATTKDFVNELKKYFKIAQVCESDNLEQCWPTKIISTDGSEVKVSEMKTGLTFNPNGWTKETLGIITADGTPMLLTYKDDCPALEAEKTYTWQTEDNKPVTNATTACIAAVYDLNGKGRPNKSGQDVRLFNAAMIGNKLQCEDPYKIGVCMMMTNLSFEPLKFGTDEYIQYTNDNGVPACPTSTYCSVDYWAGAMKACKEAGGHLPSMAQLASIINGMYHVNISAYDKGTSGLTLYDDPYSLANGSRIWSNEVDSNHHYAIGRYFDSSGSSYGSVSRYENSYKARCVK